MPKQELRPAEVFPPGEYIADELDARGWTQADLAEIMGRPVQLVNEVILGKRSITVDTAKAIAAAFGTSPELWLRMDAEYQLWKSGVNDLSDIERRARLYTLAPIKEMTRRGWIEPSENIDVLETSVKVFFGQDNLDQVPVFPYAHAARTSTYDDVTPGQRAWLFRALSLAQKLVVPSYTARAMDSVLDQLLRLLRDPNDVTHIPSILGEAGIRFLVIEPLPGTRIDGASFWLTDDAPVIAHGARYDRIDNFWFTLMHELAHIAAQDTEIDIDIDPAVSDKPEVEQKADRFATERLIPQEALEALLNSGLRLFRQPRIIAFAESIGVHPGLVVGQLQHRGKLYYGAFRGLLSPIREALFSTAITDGWGRVPA